MHLLCDCRGLCNFSHPELKEDNGQMLVFRSINQLKRQLVDTRHLQLCNICVENRKVTCAPAASFTCYLFKIISIRSEGLRPPLSEMKLQVFM